MNFRLYIAETTNPKRDDDVKVPRTWTSRDYSKVEVVQVMYVLVLQQYGNFQTSMILGF